MSIDARVAKYAQDFGNWKVDKFLGQGGFGLVVRLKRERFGVVEYCAMKIVHLCWAKYQHCGFPGLGCKGLG